MSVKAAIKAAGSVLKRYGLKIFIRRTVQKFKKHNFKKADLFLTRKQVMPVPMFEANKPMIEGLVSVVIPCYNHAQFVEEALTSIYKQSYDKIEMIIVDDCSKDASPDIVEKLLDTWHNKGRFYNLSFTKHTQNQGAHASIDEAINQTQGEYIAVLNSDDLYDTNRFELMVNCLQASKAGIGFSKVTVIDDIGKLKHQSPFAKLQDGIDDDHMFLGLCNDNLAISSGNLFLNVALYNKTAYLEILNTYMTGIF